MRCSPTALAGIALAALALGSTSCDFEGYCLDCATDDAGLSDGGENGDGGEANDADTSDGQDCTPSGIEQCDGIDNDCNGSIDDGTLPGVGDPCSSNVGECVEGSRECVGGELVCGGGAVIPVNETCDGDDNDCDGSTDENNPGGGAACGTDVGECEAGVATCQSGVLNCVDEVQGSSETCDGRDNDCDGDFDEGTGGGQCGPVSDDGLCEFGMFSCIGGQLQCQGATMPQIEVCDNMDHDCDGNNLNGFDLNNDVLNCGACGNNCYMSPPDNVAILVCDMGMCAIGDCATGFENSDGMYSTGCDYECDFQGDFEGCNGIDEDCDRMIDEDLGTPPSICAPLGECMGTVATCDGVNGYVCNYGPTVSTDANGDLIPEVACDGLDNDCDGTVDEAFPLLDTPCDDGELGECRGTGTFVCNAAETGVECMITDPGATPGTESCDNTDEDCDGTIDEGDHQVWVDIGGGVEMFKYEASRPDSDDTTSGLVNALPCSKVNALPWTNVTHPQAEAACAAIGARLCSETEWESTCDDGGSCDWSYQTNCTTYDGDTCNGNDFDTDPGTMGDQDDAVPVGSLTQCRANVGTGVFDMSGNVKEWAAERSADVNPIRGGSYNNNEVGITCSHDFLVADDSFFFPNIGFRCCR